MKRYIITGAPGTGKTTLIKALQRKGYTTFEEVSRKIIISEQRINGVKTPWQDMVGFTNLVFDQTVNALTVPITEFSFVDRGLADNIAYLQLKNSSISPKFLNFDYKKYYHSTVFVLPIWEEIYKQDEQRLQSFQEAEKLQFLLVKTYKKLGFSIEPVPKYSISKRVQFIESKIYDFTKVVF